MSPVYAPYVQVFAVILQAPLLFTLTTQDYGPYLFFIFGKILSWFKGQ